MAASCAFGHYKAGQLLVGSAAAGLGRRLSGKCPRRRPHVSYTVQESEVVRVGEREEHGTCWQGRSDDGRKAAGREEVRERERQ